MVVEIIIICVAAVIITAGILGFKLYTFSNTLEYDNRVKDLLKTVETLREENNKLKIKQAQEIQKATENETAAFYDLLKDPSKLYE